MTRPRARDVGIVPGVLVPGARNSITDVRGVRVGHCTLVEGEGRLVPGKGPVRTGVTAIIPADGDVFTDPVKAAYFDLNGCGGLLGALQISEFGLIDTPIMLTNTMSMGTVATATIRHVLESHQDAGIDSDTVIPIVSECDDSYLNDARGLHVRESHALDAIAKASQEVAEGAVGAGTGMCCYDFKGGVGTSSRKVSMLTGDYVLGVLVLANHGNRDELIIDGVPVGRSMKDHNPDRPEHGSIVMVLGTDAPVDSRQLRRLAKRTAMGLALTGSCAHNGSGDIAIAFSTANRHNKSDEGKLHTDSLISDRDIGPLFRATVEATSEAILNCLFRAETMMGRDNNVVPALPVEQTVELLAAAGRLPRSGR